MKIGDLVTTNTGQVGRITKYSDDDGHLLEVVGYLEGNKNEMFVSNLLCRGYREDEIVYNKYILVNGEPVLAEEEV